MKDTSLSNSQVYIRTNVAFTQKMTFQLRGRKGVQSGSILYKADEAENLACNFSASYNLQLIHFC